MKKALKRFIERCVEGLLLISGGTTSIILLLIVLFLFREGSSLFQKSNIESGYVLVTNSDNQIPKLTPVQVKEIFDVNITNWNQVGGPDQEILAFRMSDITKYVSEEELGANFEHIPQALNKIVLEHPGIIAFFPEQYITKDFPGRIFPKVAISPIDFLAGKDWQPTAHPAPQFGTLPLVLGTLWVSLFAILFSLPFGLAVAIYMAEIASERVRKIFKPLIELLAGIPSVVFGFFGLVVIVPFIQKLFSLPVGETALAGSIVLAIMALPTIITVAEDAMRTIPRSMKEASLALGASHWQTVYRVVIPCSISGITAAVVLGIGRAVGETMAVLMVTGNAAIIPHSLLTPVRTIPATIAAELGETTQGGAHYQALFMLGCILFLMTLVISITVEIVSAKQKSNLT